MFTTLTTAGDQRVAFPIWCLVKPGQPVIFAELKTVTGRLSVQQKAWLDDFAMSDSNVLARVWRPTDEAEVKRVLGGPA